MCQLIYIANQIGWKFILKADNIKIEETLITWEASADS